MSWSTVELYRPNFTHNLIEVQNSASVLLSWTLVSRNITLQQHISRIIIRKMTCGQLGKIIFSANTYVKVKLLSFLHDSLWRQAQPMRHERQLPCSEKYMSFLNMDLGLNVRENLPEKFYQQIPNSQHCTEDPRSLNTKWLLGFQQRESFAGTVCPHYTWA